MSTPNSTASISIPITVSAPSSLPSTAADVTRSMNELLRLVQQFGIHCDNNNARIQSEGALNAKKLQESNNAITARVAALRTKEAQQNAEMDNERQRLRDVARETQEIAARAASLPPMIDKLVATQRTVQSEKARDDAAISVLKAQKTNEVDTMLAAITRFQSTLGLTIVQDAVWLRFTFTLIDPSSPSRPFSFAARIGPKNEYIVTDVVPAIDVTTLIAKLNRDLDLSSFVAAMRRTWRIPFITATASATAAASSSSPPTPA